MDIFSFSSFGNDEKYYKNLRANLDIIKSLNARMVVYVDSENKFSKLQDDDNLSIIRIPNSNDLKESYFYRFIIPHTRILCDYFHCRDIDSIISEREIKLLSDIDRTNFYCIRDHKHHADAPYPIQGGMWGMRANLSMKHQWNNLVKWWIKNKSPFDYYSDMWFLTRYIYPHIQREGIQFDGCGSRWGGVPVNYPRQNDEDYIGKVE